MTTTTTDTAAGHVTIAAITLSDKEFDATSVADTEPSTDQQAAQRTK